MANKDRNKRSARKARAAERSEREAVQASSPASGPSKAQPTEKAKVAAAISTPSDKPSKKDAPKPKGKMRSYFDSVKTEMRRVVWPSKEELKNYSFAVIAMLVVFGVAIWLVDTGITALLVAYANLRG
ncbi:MAG: preprotein translocase subunit SecE [Atopobiaceae bacterium]|jgi:preprotein translocase subunit SecE|nr:preprotein translocase subunit SecE [Atopobiaceae bacterium]